MIFSLLIASTSLFHNIEHKPYVIHESTYVKYPEDIKVNDYRMSLFREYQYHDSKMWDSLYASQKNLDAMIQPDVRKLIKAGISGAMASAVKYELRAVPLWALFTALSAHICDCFEQGCDLYDRLKEAEYHAKLADDNQEMIVKSFLDEEKKKGHLALDFSPVDEWYRDYKHRVSLNVDEEWEDYD